MSASKVKQSPAAKPNKVAAAFSPGSANKPACLFVNKVDTAEQNGFHDNDKEEEEEEESRKLLGDDVEDATDAVTTLVSTIKFLNFRTPKLFL